MALEDRDARLAFENPEVKKYIEKLKTIISEKDKQLDRLSAAMEKSLNNFKDLKGLLKDREEQLHETLEMGKSLAEIADKALKRK